MPARHLGLRDALGSPQRQGPPRPRQSRQTDWSRRLRASLRAVSLPPPHGFCKPRCGLVGA
eukprot:2905987-Pyramimonas_sp.AAC.1